MLRGRLWYPNHRSHRDGKPLWRPSEVLSGGFLVKLLHPLLYTWMRGAVGQIPFHTQPGCGSSGGTGGCSHVE